MKMKQKNEPKTLQSPFVSQGCLPLICNCQNICCCCCYIWSSCMVFGTLQIKVLFGLCQISKKNVYFLAAAGILLLWQLIYQSFHENFSFNSFGSLIYIAFIVSHYICKCTQTSHKVTGRHSQ